MDKIGKSNEIRLQTALSNLGFTSRRKAKEIIVSGKVTVNGKTVVNPYGKVSLEHDIISVNGISKPLPKKTYILLNKPKGAVSTLKDKHAVITVVDLIKKNNNLRLFPVGRLDKDTTGFLLLTNDGELTYRLTHPKFKVKKIYQVEVTGKISKTKIQKLQKGINLEGKKTYPCRIKVLKVFKNRCKLKVILTEGRNRQIKKMFKLCGNPVLSIHRLQQAGLKLCGLKMGDYRKLTVEEIKILKKSVNM